MLCCAAKAHAWQTLGSPEDPALWADGRAWLHNPDPAADPRLSRAMGLLSLQCDKGRPVAFINHNFEVAADRVKVSLQVDNGPAVEQTWLADSAIANRPPEPRAFARTLLGHQSLTVTLTWPGAPPTSTDFPIAGLDAALAPLRRACAW